MYDTCHHNRGTIALSNKPLWYEVCALTHSNNIMTTCLILSRCHVWLVEACRGIFSYFGDRILDLLQYLSSVREKYSTINKNAGEATFSFVFGRSPLVIFNSQLFNSSVCRWWWQVLTRPPLKLTKGDFGWWSIPESWKRLYLMQQMTALIFWLGVL